MTDYPSGTFGEIHIEKSSTWRAPSAEEMRLMDRLTIEGGVSAAALMERAGSETARVITSSFRAARSFAILCGPGNNGGDGLVVAQTLRSEGLEVCVFVVAGERYSEQCLQQLSKQIEFFLVGAGSQPRCRCDAAVHRISTGDLESMLSRFDVVVDALLGTGQRSAPRQEIAAAVQAVEQAKRKGARFGVVSIDIPTGVDADSGQLFAPHITADVTVCVEAIKRGLLQFPGRGVCGSLTTVSIGLIHDSEVEFQVLEGDVLPVLGKRPADAHKGDFGKILVVGGSLGMPGAPVLTALAALRAGAGTVALVTKRSWAATQLLPECMREVLSRDGDCFEAQDGEELVNLLGGFDVVIIGPGLGLNPSSGALLARLCEGARLLGKRVVLDADAISHISLRGISLEGLDAVITPHPGEASRLLGRPTPALQENRFNSVKEIWRKYAAVAVLKGAGTLVYGIPGGRIVCRGTPYLATAGSGDVLAGMIGALCARCETSFNAACLGAWSHAVAGIVASQESGGPVLASDIARAASRVIGRLEA